VVFIILFWLTYLPTASYCCCCCVCSQLGLLYSTGLGVVIALGRHVIPVVFTTDAAVRTCTAALLPIIALFEPVCGLVFVFDGT
jgi:Na+-driven multidrug efflux pump